MKVLPDSIWRHMVNDNHYAVIGIANSRQAEPVSSAIPVNVVANGTATPDKAKDFPIYFVSTGPDRRLNAITARQLNAYRDLHEPILEAVVVYRDLSRNVIWARPVSKFLERMENIECTSAQTK